MIMDSIAIAIIALQEEETLQRRAMKVQRRKLRDLSNPFDMNDEIFKKNFRLNKPAFSLVLRYLENELPVSRNCSALTPMGQLIAVIRFLAEGGYQHGVGKDHDVEMAQPTVSKSLSSVLSILEKKLCPDWIQLKMTEEEKREAKIDFYSKCRFPGVIMCIDGTHVKITAPAKEKFLYFNRKGFYSLNVMLICDSKMRIRYVDSRYPGSNHDSHIWNLSIAKEYFQQNYLEGEKNTFILGDAGYPLEPWLITPYRSSVQGSPESVFNTKHSTTRNIIERTIGVLKNRFRCLLGARALHYNPKKATQSVNVACALHNICVHFRIEDVLPENLPEELNEIEGVEEISGNHNNVALHIRQNICRTFQ